MTNGTLKMQNNSSAKEEISNLGWFGFFLILYQMIESA